VEEDEVGLDVECAQIGDALLQVLEESGIGSGEVVGTV